MDAATAAKTLRTLTRRLAKIAPNKKLVTEVKVPREIKQTPSCLMHGGKMQRAESVHDLAFADLLHSPQMGYHR